jgi:hypothetical protein
MRSNVAGAANRSHRFSIDAECRTAARNFLQLLPRSMRQTDERETFPPRLLAFATTDTDFPRGSLVRHRSGEDGLRTGGPRGFSTYGGCSVPTLSATAPLAARLFPSTGPRFFCFRHFPDGTVSGAIALVQALALDVSRGVQVPGRLLPRRPARAATGMDLHSRRWRGAGRPWLCLASALQWTHPSRRR